MPLDFNAEPYYDNFDETKKFYRILYKPGYAVQARELTQMQTIVQDQIKKFGQHIFKDGTITLGGQRVFENDLISIKLETSYLNGSIDITKFNDVEIVGASSGTKAHSKLALPSSMGDPYTLLVKITSGNAFTIGENISCVVNSVTYNATIYATLPFNSGMFFSIDSGVFFVKGCFAYLEAQSIAVDKYSNSSTKAIGLIVNESYVSSTEDATLLDNAQGAFNYAAPGADRYKIDLILSSKDVIRTAAQGFILTKKYKITELGNTNWNSVAGTSGITYAVGNTIIAVSAGSGSGAAEEIVENFYEIARVVDGKIVVNLDKTVYSEIGKELARRTYDESGDYTVKYWPVNVLDHIDNDTTKFSIALDPGKAYIKGFEFETINQTFLELDRARDTEHADNVDVNITYGNYVYVDAVSGLFDPTAFTQVALVNSSSTTIGTARVRQFKWDNTVPGSSSSVYKMYLFEINMSSGQKFKDVITITASGATATIDALSKINGTGDTFLSGTDVPGLVFPLNNTYIKTVKDTLNLPQSDYLLQRSFNSVAFSSGQATIATANGNERFVGVSGALNDIIKDESYHIVVTNPLSSGFSAGQILRFNTAASRSITLSTPSAGAAQSATFNVGASVAFYATIIAEINANTQSEKTKTLSNYTKVIIGTGSSGGLNTTLGEKDSIGLSDIYDVSAIHNIGTNDGTTITVDSLTGNITWGTVSHTDVTENYSIDDGQRVEYYDHGNLILKSSAPASTHYLLLVVRNFTHTGSSFASVDSYSSIPYTDIPTFTDPATGVVYNLRDCIDFRPKRTDGNTTYNNTQLPSPSGTFNCDYSYYLGRMDKIIAMPDKSFLVKKGVSAVYPTVPTDTTNGMPIYAIVVPPYTGNLSEVGIKYIDNKRYTMRDIGKLDKRIKSLEYYTQLSLLEKQAKDTSIPDASNFEKFKNGFAVDPFTSQDIFAAAANTWSNRRWSWWTTWFNGSNTWDTFGAANYNANSIAEPSNIDFNAAIDPLNQELRSPFDVKFLQFKDPALVNTSSLGKLVTLNYTESEVILQKLATHAININPFNVIKFFGKLDLEPSFDQWVDTDVLPVVHNIVDVTIPDAPDITIDSRTGRGKLIKNAGSSTVTNTSITESAAQSLGARVVDIQFVPFIRSKTVVGVTSGVKPKSQLYPFMENVNISAHCRPLKLLTITGGGVGEFTANGEVHEALSFTGGGTALLCYYSQPLLTDNTKRVMAIYNQTGSIAVGNTITGAHGGTATISDITEYALGDALLPDDFGFLGFEFQIPASTFRTGERTLRLINELTNDTELSSSMSEAKYMAIGLVQSKQENMLTTRVLQNQRVTTLTGKRYDPLAQSFTVDPDIFQQGMAISSVDVFFKSKSSTVPVVMQIRRMVNGYPESDPTIPFAEITLKPENVSISSNASVATTFTFPSAIHLTPGDYAIVILANTQDYEVYVAETGKVALGTTVIVDKPPYIGSLFKSQNAATWTPVQEQDLKFVIRRAVFETTGTADFEVVDPGSDFNYHTLYANSSNITPNETNISWSAAVYTDGAIGVSQYTPININTDINYSELKKLQNFSAHGFATLKLKATLTTNNSAVSPAIDTSALSVVVVENKINNDFTNEAGNKRSGNAIAKYITKPINLADGFDASNLCVTLDANKPSGTNIRVYYKTLPTEKVTPIADEVWVEMNLESAVASSATSYDFKEHKYFPNGAFDNYHVPIDSPISTKFNTFQIKIVLLSNSTVYTPRIRDLRIIALDS